MNYIKDKLNTVIEDIKENKSKLISIGDERKKALIKKIKINTVLDEIEFFVSNDKNKQTRSLYNILNNDINSTKTSMELKKLLNNPINSIKQLKIRQQLVINAYHDLYDLLKPIIKNENNYYWFIDTENEQKKELYDFIYFKKYLKIIDCRFCNDNKYVMHYYFILFMIILPLWSILNPFIVCLIPFLISNYVFGHSISFKDYYKSFKKTLTGNQLFGVILVAINFLIITIMSKRKDTGYTLMQNIKLFILKIGQYIFKTNIAKYIYLVFLLVGYFSSGYNTFILTKKYNDTLNFIYNITKHSYNLLNTVNKLNNYFKSNNMLITDEIKYYITKSSLILEKINNIQLLSKTYASYFNSDYNILKNKGIFLTYYHKLINIISEEDIDLCYEYCCHCNMYCHLTLIIKKYNLSKAVYLKRKQPELTIYKLNNLLIENFTPNSINLYNNLDTHQNDNEHNTDGRQLLLLTGPNGTGKSTFLKTIMSAVVLSQTIGFSHCDAITLTPFYYLSTYLNIPDCIGKESLFQAEMKRSLEHLKKMEEYEKNGYYSFNIIDELFVSTNYYEGMSGAWGIINKLKEYKNSISIITTHFDKCIENPIDDYMYLHFTMEDNYEKSYKLLKGVNKKHCALNLLRSEGFSDDIIELANSKYNEVTKNNKGNK